MLHTPRRRAAALLPLKVSSVIVTVSPAPDPLCVSSLRSPLPSLEASLSLNVLPVTVTPVAVSTQAVVDRSARAVGRHVPVNVHPSMPGFRPGSPDRSC